MSSASWDQRAGQMWMGTLELGRVLQEPKGEGKVNVTRCSSMSPTHHDLRQCALPQMDRQWHAGASPGVVSTSYSQEPSGPWHCLPLSRGENRGPTLPIVPACPGASPAHTVASLRPGLGPFTRSWPQVRAHWCLQSLELRTGSEL